jgi:hypothetical protein
MQLSDTQRKLLDLAEGHVRDFVGKRGAFGMFAVARQPDGADQVMQSSGEFATFTEELSAMFQVLRPLARDGVIDASVICSPVDEGKRKLAVLDVETRADGRLVVMLPFQKKFLGGWTFGERQYNQDAPRVFAP